MSPILRIVTRSRCTSATLRVQSLYKSRPAVCGQITWRSAFSTTATRKSGAYDTETFEEFTTRYENEFNTVNDVFELQRNLNNAFAYDLVPAPSVIEAALRAARRCNDFPTAVRIFEGIKEKVENPGQYEEYLKELEPIREELGVSLKEILYPGEKWTF